MKLRKRSGALLGLLTFMFSCATPQPVYRLGDGQLVASGVRNILVLPLNITIAMPTEVEGKSEQVFEQLGNYFTAQQRKAVTVGVIEANRVWVASMEEVEASDLETKGYEAAMTVMARRLGRSGSFDAIVVPDLVFRNAKLSRQTAQWDGVKRRFKTVRAPGAVEDSVIRTMSFGGSTSGVSFRARIYSPAGDFAFEGFGGIELVHQVDLTDIVRKRRFRYEIRPDLLEDLDLIRKGITQAFVPYFEPPEPTAW